MTDISPDDRSFRRPVRGDGRALLGVCGGLARRWKLDPLALRVAFLVTLLPFGAGLLLYLALAVVMPVDGASDEEAGWRNDIGRSLVEALIVLGGLLVVGVIVAAGTVLAVFGLGAVALLLATVLLLAVLIVGGTRAWLLGVATLALALPAAAVALTDVQVGRQFGTLVAAPLSPHEVDRVGYHAGTGPLLVDLRGFDADTDTTTTIRATADLRPLVVALPRDRCFNLVVDYQRIDPWISRGTDAVNGSLLGGSLAQDERTQAGGDRRGPALMAYGQPIPGNSGRWERRAFTTHATPTLHLVLRSQRASITVRDYPDFVGPLFQPNWPSNVKPVRLPVFAAGAAVQIDPKNGTIRSAVPLPSTASAKKSVIAASALISEALRQRNAASALLDQELSQKRPTVRALRGTLLAAQARADYPKRQAERMSGACGDPERIKHLAKRYEGQMSPTSQVEYLNALSALAVTNTKLDPVTRATVPQAKR